MRDRVKCGWGCDLNGGVGYTEGESNKTGGDNISIRLVQMQREG